MTSTKKWIQFNNELIRQLKLCPPLRKGQAYMNTLDIIDPIVYNQITNTEADCFYDDSRMEAFVEKLSLLWER